MKINIDKLKEVIASTGLSNNKFAIACCIDYATLYRLLSAKQEVSIITLLKICDYVGIVDVRDLLLPYETIPTFIEVKKKEISKVKLLTDKRREFYKNV